MARHHYISRGLQSNFCFEGEQIYYYSKHAPQNGVKPRNTGSIFQKSNLNARKLAPGKFDNSLEDFFSVEFDDYVPKFLAMLNDYHFKNGNLDKGLMRRFIQFLYNHWNRTPDRHQKTLKDVVSRKNVLALIAKYESEYRKVSEQEKQLLLSNELMEDRKNEVHIRSLFKQSEKVLNAFAEMYFVTASPSTGRKQFILGSNPVVRFENSLDTSLKKGDIEIWTTLTPKLAFGLLTVESKYPKIILDDKRMELLNSEIFNQSSSVAAKNRKILESLVAKQS